MSQGDELTVEFKVKDLFLDIKNSLNEIKQKMDLKAEKVEVDKLEGEVRELQKRQAAKAATDDLQKIAIETRRQWVGIAASTLLGLGALFIDLFRH